MKHTVKTSDEVILERSDIIAILKASGVKIDAENVNLSWIDGPHRRNITGDIIVTWNSSKKSDKDVVATSSGVKATRTRSKG